MAEPWFSLPDGRPFFPASGSHCDRPVVLGLGNILLSDEGVGVHAAAALKKQYAFKPEIDIVDGGTMGLDLLPLFQDRCRILILDAVEFRKAPGHIQLLEGDDIHAALGPKFSVHHIGLADLLLAAKFTRQTAREISLIGIQPHSFEMGLELSAPVLSALGPLAELVIKKLEGWSVHARPISETDRRHGLSEMQNKI